MSKVKGRQQALGSESELLLLHLIVQIISTIIMQVNNFATLFSFWQCSSRTRL